MDKNEGLDALEEMLLSLLEGEHSSLHLTFNEENGPDYQSVEDLVTHPRSNASEIQWISAEEKIKACKENKIWTLRWYPRTPIGFSTLSASSLSALLDRVFNG